MNKKKIFNDPVYGFITIPYDIIFDLIEHPYFQRLRRIHQLGLTYLVFPGATHSRFHHAIGAMHLMVEAIEVLRYKGHDITEEEAEAVIIAILLHDIGHGPFSHVLENSLVKGVSHEDLSLLFMNKLNSIFNGKLSLAIEIFSNNYHKKFLHQLVSSQLDMDRLDYLNRDSFYSGVSEGVIGSERIIKMLEVYDNRLAVEAKGIYSIEKFIVSRRLMYWQVYLHKTVVSAEQLLVKILLRAKFLARTDKELFTTPAFRPFLYGEIGKEDFTGDEKVLKSFAELDDFDIFTSIKAWREHPDRVLSMLSDNIVSRKLFKIRVQNKPFDENEIEAIKKKLGKETGFTEEELKYVVFDGALENNAYNTESDKINILFKDGSVLDIADASDHLNISVLSSPIRKYYLCFPGSTI